MSHNGKTTWVTRSPESNQLQVELRRALAADEVRFVLTWAMSLSAGSLGDGLRVEYKDYGQKRWSKVKGANGKDLGGVFPGEDQTVVDVFQMLYDARLEERDKRDRQR